MTREEELESKIFDIIENNYLYGNPTVSELIVECITPYLKPEINWDQVRIDAAIRIAGHIASSSKTNSIFPQTSFEVIVSNTVKFADQLVEELKKYTHGHETND